MFCFYVFEERKEIGMIKNVVLTERQEGKAQD